MTGTTVSDYVFDGVTSSFEVSFSDTVTTIGSSSFKGCAGLTSIELPASLTGIGFDAFENCTGLTAVVIPDSVTAIDSRAFRGCTALESVTLPASLETVGNNAFEGCTALAAVEFPDSVRRIGTGAFKNCTGLVSAVFPDSLESIGAEVFSGCTALAEINIPASPVSVGYQAFRRTAFPAGKEKLRPETFENYKDEQEKHPKIKKGKKILPLIDGDFDLAMYQLLPEDVRTADPKKADYALLTETYYRSRSDFTGPARDAVANVYLYPKKGKPSLLCYMAHYPPMSGTVSYGGSLDGEMPTAQELLDAVGDILP